jgi:hypothetical protein
MDFSDFDNLDLSDPTALYEDSSLISNIKGLNLLGFTNVIPLEDDDVEVSYDDKKYIELFNKLEQLGFKYIGGDNPGNYISDGPNPLEASDYPKPSRYGDITHNDIEDVKNHLENYRIWDLITNPNFMREFYTRDTIELIKGGQLNEETITGEYEGKPVKFKIKDIEGIKDILNRSKGAKDFVNKLSMAVTDETSSLSKEDIKKVILFYKNQGKQLKENENIKVNVNKEEDEVEIFYKGESFKSALGDELLFIHYFEEDEQAAGLLHRGENDAPEIFKYLKGKGGELEVDDKEATLTINMSNLKKKKKNHHLLNASNN